MVYAREDGDATGRLIRVVTLWVHPGKAAAFEAFEREAVRIMARHGGRIDLAVRLAPPDGVGPVGRPDAGGAADTGGGPPPFELHIVSFPDQAAFEAYGADSETLALRSRRELIVARTDVVAGRAAGPYGDG